MNKMKNNKVKKKNEKSKKWKINLYYIKGGTQGLQKKK